MAKPIEATPDLCGEDAERFIKWMIEEQKNPDPKRIKLIREARKIKFNYVD
jgi:hypothetical protein